jgi:transposase
MRYLRGEGRYQQSFLSLDDHICKSNVVRFLDELCEDFSESFLSENSFNKGVKDTGRKAYHPGDLLKILIYGYFNGVNSSRKLERETNRNIELKWLIGNILPDHKTIADFRKDNPELVTEMFSYLILKFKEQGLITGKKLVIDGTKVKGYASHEIRVDSIQNKLDNIETQVSKYLKDMATIDHAEDDIEELEEKRAVLNAELEKLAAKKKSYENDLSILQKAGQKRLTVTDLDCRMMRSRYGMYFGYNVQAAVDTTHHFITQIETTNNQNDKGLLIPMVENCEHLTGEHTEEISADAGYYKIDELEELEKKSTACYVAINRTPTQVNDQLNNLTFTYHKQEDRYYCNEGKKLDYFRKKNVDGRECKIYRGIECTGCVIKSKCTSVENRSITRNPNQEWIDSYHDKMNSLEGQEKIKKRKSIAEHPFGTIKYLMGQIPLLLRGRKKVQTEMNLYAIGYNLKRYFNIKTAASKNQNLLRTAA